MNAAFLLVTTAWLAGADADAPAGKPEGLKAPAATAASTHCSSCNSCCEKESCWDRLRNRFRRSSCDDCCSKPVVVSCYTKPCGKPVCCKPAKPCCEKVTCCKTTCDSCCDKPSLWDRLRSRFSKDCDSCNHGCAKSCDHGCKSSCHNDCGCGETKGLLNRLRERMKKDDCCCNTCGSAPATRTETLPNKPKEEPKKMPDGVKTSHTLSISGSPY